MRIKKESSTILVYMIINGKGSLTGRVQYYFQSFLSGQSNIAGCFLIQYFCSCTSLI